MVLLAETRDARRRRKKMHNLVYNMQSRSWLSSKMSLLLRQIDLIYFYLLIPPFMHVILKEHDTRDMQNHWVLLLPFLHL
jgi:hypothetical protein